MCVTDCHDMTLAVKVALNPNTTNYNNPFSTMCNSLLLTKSLICSLIAVLLANALGLTSRCKILQCNKNVKHVIP